VKRQTATRLAICLALGAGACGGEVRDAAAGDVGTGSRALHADAEVRDPREYPEWARLAVTCVSDDGAPSGPCNSCGAVVFARRAGYTNAHCVVPLAKGYHYSFALETYDLSGAVPRLISIPVRAVPHPDWRALDELDDDNHGHPDVALILIDREHALTWPTKPLDEWPRVAPPDLAAEHPNYDIEGVLLHGEDAGGKVIVARSKGRKLEYERRIFTAKYFTRTVSTVERGDSGGGVVVAQENNRLPHTLVALSQGRGKLNVSRVDPVTKAKVYYKVPFDEFARLDQPTVVEWVKGTLRAQDDSPVRK
jgi:hypothetical protein